MPVVFAPPDPVDPSGSYNFGFSNTYTPGAIAQLQRQAQYQQQLRLASLSGGGGGGGGGGGAGPGLSGPGQQDLAANEAQWRASQQYNQQQGQANLQTAQAQNAAWLNQQELSQAEAARLQRMQQAVGQVQGDDSLLPEEKQNLITQLRTGIDPLKMRQEATQQKSMDLQLKQQQAAAKQAEVLQAGGAKVRSQTFNDRVVPLLDQTTKQPAKDAAGQPIEFYEYEPNKWKQVDRHSGKGPTDTAPKDAKTQLQHAQAISAEQRKHEQDWDTGVNKIQKEVEDRAKETVDNGPGTPKHPRYEELQTREGQTKEFERLMGVHEFGLKKSEHVARKMAKWLKDSGLDVPKVGGGEPAAKPQMVPPGRTEEENKDRGEEKKTEPTPPAERKPFDRFKEETQTKEQKADVAAWTSMARKIQAAPIPDGEKAGLTQMASQALDHLAAHGSEENMRKKDQKAYEEYQLFKAHFATALRPRPAYKPPGILTNQRPVPKISDVSFGYVNPYGALGRQ